MADFLADLRDIKFVVFNQIGVEKLLEQEKFSEFDASDFEAMLDQGLKVAKEVFGPMSLEGDKIGAKWENGKVTMPPGTKEAWELMRENQYIGMNMPSEWGGMDLPQLIFTAIQDLFVGANPALALTPMLTVGTGHLIEAFGTDYLKKTYVEKMYTGQWTGTMCLTEPGAGTDVGNSKTKAFRQPDGTYLIEGSKIFITSGDHDLTENIIHAVLARIEGDPPGTKGISLFVVPKFLVNDDGTVGAFNDVRCPGIEHKMGIHGSPTCQLSFGEDGKCRGWLLGNERDGMKLMFQMMNEARIGVGLQGAASANAAYQLALAYSKERLQGPHFSRLKDPTAPRVAIVEHPDIRRSLMLQKAYSEGMRALLYTAAYYGDLAETMKDPEQAKSYHAIVEVLTPICKAYCSDMGFKVTELAMQTHGGYGYCHEYGVEQMMRDVKIASIYEGANGIQAMDLVGRKLGMNMGANFMAVVNQITQFIEAHKEHPELEGAVKKLIGARDAVNEAAMYFAMTGSSDVTIPLLNASPFLELFGDALIGKLLLEQAVMAQEKFAAIAEEKGVNLKRSKKVQELLAEDEEAAYFWNKVKTAQFFAHSVLTLAPAKAEAIKTGDTSAMEA
ncbi:MAG: acyl-CoA dehydrogenase, partial [Polyangia bacterium]|nr:acyl-CoA dehydrogenase [Polyangia bacterium]